MAVCPNPKPRGFSPICLPVSPERYQQIIGSPALYRQWLDEALLVAVQHPQLFRPQRVDVERRMGRDHQLGTGGGAAALLGQFVQRSAWAARSECAGTGKPVEEL